MCTTNTILLSIRKKETFSYKIVYALFKFLNLIFKINLLLYGKRTSCVLLSKTNLIYLNSILLLRSYLIRKRAYCFANFPAFIIKFNINKIMIIKCCNYLSNFKKIVQYYMIWFLI